MNKQLAGKRIKELLAMRDDYKNKLANIEKEISALGANIANADLAAIGEKYGVELSREMLIICSMEMHEYMTENNPNWLDYPFGVGTSAELYGLGADGFFLIQQEGSVSAFPVEMVINAIKRFRE